MKKPQVRKLIRESIKQLMNELKLIEDVEDFTIDRDTGQKKHNCWECMPRGCRVLGQQTGNRTDGCMSGWKCFWNCDIGHTDPNY